MLRKNFPNRRLKRRQEAEARNAEYRALTTQYKLASLPVTGATKQRAKLEALLAQEQAG